MSTSDNQKTRKRLLWVSLAVNLGLLALFKYYDFFAESVSYSLQSIGLDLSIPTLQLILPVGISFYTFQTMSYTIDAYNRKIDHEPSFIKFATYVAFFPQLVAGPIVRATTFLPQLRKPTVLSRAAVTAGILLIIIGLSKKIFLADLLAYYFVDRVFENPSMYASSDLLVTLYAYAFQIYCDFSGYSDIAIGVALLLGFTLPINFNKPYLAQSPSDFWRRWHITLSEWLRDYVYIPLGGKSSSKFKTSKNLMIVMLVGGLWHGAAWNFVLWGLWHGIMLIIFRSVVIEKTWNLARIVKVFLTFHLVVFSWLLFRVPNLASLQEYVGSMLEFSYGSAFSSLAYSILVVAFIAHYIPVAGIINRASALSTKASVVVISLILIPAFLLFIGASVNTSVFVYFQF